MTPSFFHAAQRGRSTSAPVAAIRRQASETNTKNLDPKLLAELTQAGDEENDEKHDNITVSEALFPCLFLD